jgi:hypothetical protein
MPSLKLNLKSESSPPILPTTKPHSLMKLKQEKTNMPLGLEKMENMLTKLNQSTKLASLFNTYKPVLPLLKLKADLKKSKPNLLKEHMLSSSPLLMP